MLSKIYHLIDPTGLTLLAPTMIPAPPPRAGVLRRYGGTKELPITLINAALYVTRTLLHKNMQVSLPPVPITTVAATCNGGPALPSPADADASDPGLMNEATYVEGTQLQ